MTVSSLRDSAYRIHDQCRCGSGHRSVAEGCSCCAGREQDCVADCGRLLSMIEHRGAAGLEAGVLRLRASAALQLRQLDAAEADVSMALAAQPGDVGLLLLQAEVGPV